VSSARQQLAAAVAAQAVLERGLPKFTFLNINTPKGPNKGFRVTVQAKRNHVTTVDERIDPRHKPYYWIEKGRTSGSRTIGLITRPCATGTFRSRRCSPT
jgi:5'/3'-nucleotidase SurE